MKTMYFKTDAMGPNPPNRLSKTSKTRNYSSVTPSFGESQSRGRSPFSHASIDSGLSEQISHVSWWLFKPETFWSCISRRLSLYLIGCSQCYTRLIVGFLKIIISTNIRWLCERLSMIWWVSKSVYKSLVSKATINTYWMRIPHFCHALMQANNYSSTWHIMKMRRLLSFTFSLVTQLILMVCIA